MLMLLEISCHHLIVPEGCRVVTLGDDPGCHHLQVVTEPLLSPLCSCRPSPANRHPACGGIHNGVPPRRAPACGRTRSPATRVLPDSGPTVSTSLCRY